MMDNTTAEKRADGALVLTIPEEEFDDFISALEDGETCCRAFANEEPDEEQRDMALEAAQNLNALSNLTHPIMWEDAPKGTRLRIIKNTSNGGRETDSNDLA